MHKMRPSWFKSKSQAASRVPSVAITNYIKLWNIFNRNGWDIKGQHKIRFYNHLRVLEHLSKDEQALFLQLTKHFIYYGSEKYVDGVCDALSSLLKLDDRSITTYHVLPVLKKKDYEKRVVKSSHTVQYLFKGDTLEEHVDPGDRLFKFAIFEKLKKHPLKKGERVLLVDDFVGTGSSVDEAIEFYTGEESAIRLQDISVLSIFAHRKGIEHLSSSGIPFYYSQVVDRGISDHYLGDELSDRIKLMEAIESRIPQLNNEYKFGYGQCEALVHMIRVPNNTFPIYWCWKGISPYSR